MSVFWGPNRVKDGTGFASDPDPNTDEALAFDVGDRYGHHAGYNVMITCQGGTSVTYTLFLHHSHSIGGVNQWVQIGGATVNAGTTSLVPVPPNARVYVRFTAEVGGIDAAFAGLIPV